jgi:2-polyprenyl-3-methyl-5-hydroxy-6-metoxy-1,4-benzoquinol methylase
MTALRHDPAREEAELRAFLGDAYDHGRLVRWEEQLEEEARSHRDEQRVYRESEAYLYNLTAFAMSGTKLPYLREILKAVPPPARLIDVGCGIGSDGLMLIEAGYEVTFADFDNPSTRYLRHRLESRGVRANVVDLDLGPLPKGFALAYAFDVLEHVPDPLAVLGAMEHVAKLVCVNLLDTSEGDSVLHHPLPVDAILRRAKPLRVDRRFHGRSRLLVYG